MLHVRARDGLAELRSSRGHKARGEVIRNSIGMIESLCSPVKDVGLLRFSLPAFTALHKA